jgi:hypothetical protein
VHSPLLFLTERADVPAKRGGKIAREGTGGLGWSAALLPSAPPLGPRDWRAALLPSPLSPACWMHQMDMAVCTVRPQGCIPLPLPTRRAFVHWEPCTHRWERRGEERRGEERRAERKGMRGREVGSFASTCVQLTVHPLPSMLRTVIPAPP